ncbi:MAG TPA: hypothetical protein ENH67_05705 [Pseudoalteromonas sp.]|uniref:Sulfotransferase domain-containing protein n=1 Tax=marine sediment metagenome TaxID=412755 RepID=A0A0F9S219_9ZZZZ|nr:hypothetical protein [Pseudoalteromonas sp.]HDY92146.1 hypothetical protein [Pseudoalteromonas sp.]HDZ32365.1 hypothetical protein [Pseudoalteromonas sp.]
MSVKVVIHIGPPKTGTSAIQFCLQQDKQRLAENGIYYPKHATDVNGISSGNLSSVYDITNTERSISKTKVSKLLASCEKLKMHTLLLSSEFFFERMSEVVGIFPEAQFIAYIRNPLDSFESLYNQSIKRHHKIEPIKKPPLLPKFYLTKLERFVDEIGADKFVFRSYSKHAFFGGTIVDDFYSILSIQPPSNTRVTINPSYSFEALEFKRWINQFCSPSLALQADKVLQSFDSSSAGFSLIEPQMFDLYKAQAFKFLKKLSHKYSVFGSEQLLEDVQNTKQADFKSQRLELDDFMKVADYLNQQNPSLYKSICYALYLSSYRSCFTNEYGQVFIKKYKLSEVSDHSMLKVKILNFVKRLLGKPIYTEELPFSLSTSDDINRLRAKLKLDSDISDIEILRELAFLAEKNHDIGLAYVFMKRAQKLRPNGPLINNKIKYYERKIDNAKTDK